MRALQALPALALLLTGCVGGLGDPSDDPAPPAENQSVAPGSAQPTVLYATRSVQALRGAGADSFARDVWANVTLTRGEAGWSGLCERHENETVSARDPATAHTRGTVQVDFDPLRESTALEPGQMIRVEYVSDCGLAATGMVVEGKERRAGREVWVARSPSGPPHSMDEEAWWDAQDGLLLGWNITRSQAVEKGRTMVP